MIASASRRLGAKGFSLNRCFPEAMICLSSATCSWGGVRLTTISTDSSFSSSSVRQALGMSNSLASFSASARFTSAQATIFSRGKKALISAA